ncbi:hypothetical protein IWX92DRAFT_226441 [Phyllosticta citricarpa]
MPRSTPLTLKLRLKLRLTPTSAIVKESPRHRPPTSTPSKPRLKPCSSSKFNSNKCNSSNRPRRCMLQPQSKTSICAATTRTPRTPPRRTTTRSSNNNSRCRKPWRKRSGVIATTVTANTTTAPARAKPRPTTTCRRRGRSSSSNSRFKHISSSSMLRSRLTLSSGNADVISTETCLAAAMGAAACLGPGRERHSMFMSRSSCVGDVGQWCSSVGRRLCWRGGVLFGV